MVEKTKINVFAKIFKSIADFDAYKIFAKGKLSSAFSYFFVIAFILSLISLVTPAISIYETAGLIKEGFVEDIPDLNFANGELTIHTDNPIVLEEDDIIIIIDTSGEFSEEDLKGYSNGLFVGKNKLVQKENVVEFKTIDFSELTDLTFTKETVEKYLYLIDIVFIIGIVIAFFIKFIGYLFVALWLSLLALIFNSSLKAKLPYKQLFIISIHVMTLPSLIGSLSNLFGISIPFYVVIYNVIACVYLLKTIRLIKNDNEEGNNLIEIENM